MPAHSLLQAVRNCPDLELLEVEIGDFLQPDGTISLGPLTRLKRLVFSVHDPMVGFGPLAQDAEDVRGEDDESPVPRADSIPPLSLLTALHLEFLPTEFDCIWEEYGAAAAAVITGLSGLQQLRELPLKMYFGEESSRQVSLRHWH